MDIEKQVASIVENIVAELNDKIQAQVVELVDRQVADAVKRIPIRALFETSFAGALENQTFEWPSSSIPSYAIDTANLAISGNSVAGGIIKNFGSTGIDDRATACQVTVMDDVTVVENNLLTRDLTVKGTTTIEGDLNVTGTVPETSPLYVSIVNAATNNVRSDQSLFKSYANLVFQQIQDTGIDLSRITLKGQELIDGNNLSNTITYSNLQRVGALQELQVTGESLLSETLYTTRTRVGVNTIEPAQALSVWDQEIEIGVGKQSNNTGVIGTPRNQTLVVSSNGKNNLTLTPDGATTVNQLNIGSVISITTGSMPPTTNQPKGAIVFNENPSLGGPMGWVSLGDARWANFGVID